MNIIGHVIALVPLHIHEINGHQILATFLKKCKDNHRRKACMKALLSASKFEFFKIELAEKNIIETLLEIISNVDEPGTLYLRELSFNILSNICKACRENQKTFRRLKGIEAIRGNLNNSEVD